MIRQPPKFKEALEALAHHHVDFVVVGGVAAADGDVPDLSGGYSGMLQAIHSPSCWRSASVGAGLSGGMPVLVAAGPAAVVSSM